MTHLEIQYHSDIWRVIKDFPDYAINPYGEIKRITKGGNNFCKIGRILKARKEKNGYYRLNLHIKNKIKRITVHRLVALTFIGPPPTLLHEVAHNDGTRDNNHVSNLRWCTRKENHSDKKKHGTSQCGSKNGNSKLTLDQVIEIKQSDIFNAD